MSHCRRITSDISKLSNLQQETLNLNKIQRYIDCQLPRHEQPQLYRTIVRNLQITLSLLINLRIDIPQNWDEKILIHFYFFVKSLEFKTGLAWTNFLELRHHALFDHLVWAIDFKDNFFAPSLVIGGLNHVIKSGIPQILQCVIRLKTVIEKI